MVLMGEGGKFPQERGYEMPTTFPDWVTERSHCDLQAVFGELVSIIERDIEKYEKIPGEYRPHNRSFKHTPRKGSLPDRTFEVSQVSKIPPSETLVCRLTFSRGPLPAIQVLVYNKQKDEEELLTLTSEWDTENVKCWLKVERPEAQPGDPCRMALDHIWKISQYILEPFLFGA